LHTVVIVGGGFGGLEAARALRRAPVDVLLVDRNNYHLFQPLLYQVATAGLSPGDIASPLRWILRRQRNVRIILGEAREVDLARRVVKVDGDEVGYDHLILSPGSSHHYFGHDDWADLAPGLKDLPDALEIRRRVLLAFERAERAKEEDEQRVLTSFVVVGGGPTGVELAGAIAEIARNTLAREFRGVDPRRSRVMLVEAGPTILASYPPDLREAARRSLRRLGVQVLERTPVTDVGERRLTAGGELLEAETILWAAGVAASPLLSTLKAPCDRVGRILVEPGLTVPGWPNVFVIGDGAAVRNPDGSLVPGVAQAAMQEGRYAARAILSAMRGVPARPFRYRSLGDLATIGRAAAVADFGRLHLSGWPAWLAWLFVHIMKLVGFRNRILVLVQWAWAYFTQQRSVRLIVRNR